MKSEFPVGLNHGTPQPLVITIHTATIIPYALPTGAEVVKSGVDVGRGVDDTGALSTV